MPPIDRRALRQAMRKRDLDKLEEVLKAAAENDTHGHLDLEIQEAQHLLGKLRHLDIVKAALREMKEPKRVEKLMNQSPPHFILFTVMKAVLVILGVPEKDLQDWAGVEKVIGKTTGDQQAFIDYVANMDTTSLHYRNIKRAREIMCRFNLNVERVASICQPLVPFYCWVATFTDESLEKPSPSLDSDSDWSSISSGRSTCSTYFDSDMASVRTVTSATSTSSRRR